MNWIIAAFLLLIAHNEYIIMSSPTPLKLPGHTKRLTPFIRHWEAANFDREYLHTAHQKHIEQKRHRRKRALKTNEYGPVHTIRLNFYAHDREFRLVLRQDPLSVFAGDVQIENTLGPMDYDISRIYTGSLEGDENSLVHAILTSDNLLDGTIETSTEHYYLEPSHRYSRDLPSSGVHSIVYKVSDVDLRKSAEAEHCASEQLRRSTLRADFKRRKSQVTDDSAHAPAKSNSSLFLRRTKRWLPDELSPSNNEHQNPPLPLDLDVPYNDDFSILTHTNNNHGNVRNDIKTQSPLDKETTLKSPASDRDQQPRTTWRNGDIGVGNAIGGTSFSPSLVEGTSTTKITRNRNIIVNNYNPNESGVNGNGNSNNNNNNNGRNMYTKHKNIIVSTHNIKNSNNNQTSIYGRNNDNESGNGYFDGNGNFVNSFFNTNWTTMFAGNDRPSHKTHVEIITKNGATKKPNIIVNNYNPEIILAPNPHNPHFNSMLMTNLLSGRGQDAAYETGSAASSRSQYDRKITCMLYLQADHTFFQKMGSDEASIEAITRHVQRANSIYKNTDFNNDGKPDNITFMIKRIKVHNMNAVKDPAYRFPGNYGVEKFLELFSEEDYDAFCLAYMFTYRDFEMGTLGLAWTGDLKNAGGVCEKNGHYRGSLKSLNTGIVTLLNYGKHVPPAVSHVTLAHEIGHNFGSPHDPEQCTPGGEDGNFIMFARATSGDKKNNNKFSPCSLKSIEPVLNAKARSSKGCFTEPQTSICGNGVVEPGEQCDCGWEEDCKDSCCFPMSRHPRIGERPCTLTPRSMCSPSQGPCCTNDCKLKFGDKCRDDNGCRDPSFCDGRMPQCPPSVNKPNKTICNKEFVCYMGDCTGSICLAYGLESCQCIPGPIDDKIKSCELCCKLPGENNLCRSSFEWNDPPFDVPDMYAKPGTPCNDYNGYCDVFQKCREVDPSGPLATLRKLLLSEESIATFKKWMQQNWYSVALAAVGVIVLLILSTKLLAKRSNLKLKSVTIIHSATTETVRLPEDNNGVIVHTAVRTKVPFKKKVRGERSRKIKSSNSTSNGNSYTNADTSKKSRGNGSKFAKSSSKSTNAHNRSSKIVLPIAAARTKKNRVAFGGLNGAQATAATPAMSAGTTTAVTNGSAASSTDQTSKEKKMKRSKKHSKEIIDYSAPLSAKSPNSPSTSHTNTFGKVQKWLLESPIVAQPLSHIEHSSKVRKVISKSQSTPERLVQKSQQKTKSVGNLANEKVKLQVVYKPPFKFALRLSKNTKVKTHVIGSGAVNKFKRQVRCSAAVGANAGTEGKGTSINQNNEGSKSSTGDEVRTKRTALLYRANNKSEDNQILALNEPNYETLNPKTTPANSENPFYENMQHTQTTDEHTFRSNISEDVIKVPTIHPKSYKASSSPSKTNFEHDAALAVQCQLQQQRPHSYNRSYSLSTNNQITAEPGRSTRKLSDSHQLLACANLNRNFSSTQNLINSTQSNSNKSKKRSSLNLKSSTASKNDKDLPGLPAVQQARRSASNINLKCDGVAGNVAKSLAHNTNNVICQQQQRSPQLQHSASKTSYYQQQQQLPLNSSTVTDATGTAISTSHQLSPYVADCSSRANFSNIPRATLNSATVAANIGGSSSNIPTQVNNSISNFSFGHQSPPAADGTDVNGADTDFAAHQNNNPHRTSSGSSISNPVPLSEHRRSRSSVPQLQCALFTNSSSRTSAQAQKRSNSIRQHPHNYHPPPLSLSKSAISSKNDTEQELPSDLEVMVSDVENLVS